MFSVPLPIGKRGTFGVFCTGSDGPWIGTKKVPFSFWVANSVPKRLVRCNNMTDKCKPRRVIWEDVVESADKAFSVFLPQVGLKWARNAWAILSKSGLTSYSTETERYTVLFRFLVLAGIYRDFCDAAFDEYSYLEYGDWAEPLELDSALVFQMVGKDPKWEIEEYAEVDSALLFLVEKHRNEVYKALSDGFGGVNGLFESLWLITHTREDDDDDEPLTQSDAFWPETVERMQAFGWVSEGCPRYR